MSVINLERSQPSAFAPAPKAVRAGDYVFTSSIYPIDNKSSCKLRSPFTNGKSYGNQ